LMRQKDYSLPHRLPNSLHVFVPAYWVIPSRCFLYRDSRPISSLVRRTSDLFYRFKMGISKLAYPLALGIYEELQERALLDFDCIVPIPLSPDKVKNKEIHRTLLLARELGRLLGVEVADALRLSRPTSKSILRIEMGLTPRQFEAKYVEALTVDSGLKSYTRILVLDDVCTEGSTLRAAATAIMQTGSNQEITAAVAGQMIMRAVVRDDSMLVAT
jgi:predicted amidophosphoribosyltransferase